MTVTTYQDYVRPTMIPTEGSGKVYLRFENLPKAAGGPTLGPYPYVNCVHRGCGEEPAVTLARRKAWEFATALRSSPGESALRLSSAEVRKIKWREPELSPFGM
jgi:hypothetical protein